jgi:endonuclease III
VKASLRLKATPARRRKVPLTPRRWAAVLRRHRPGLVDFTLDAVASMYGRPVWQRRNDPTSELILTILSQNSADVNAERAFEALRLRYPSVVPRSLPSGSVLEQPPPGWGGVGIGSGPPPDWLAVESAPLEELTDTIRPGGLANQKAPRIQASLRALREARGDHSLDFLGDLPASEAAQWLTSIGGIGPKTAAVVLLFSFGMPLMPVDRHVERVSKRVGLIPARATAEAAHELFLAVLEPDQVYEAHVNLITHGRQTCHAQRPACHRCAVAPRCRYLDARAP